MHSDLVNIRCHYVHQIRMHVPELSIVNGISTIWEGLTLYKGHILALLGKTILLIGRLVPIWVCYSDVLLHQYYKLLITFIGSTGELEVLIEGQGNETTANIGDNITFICTLRSAVHYWSVPTFNVNSDVMNFNSLPSTIQAMGMSFTTRLLSVEGQLITTSLSVLATANFNGTLVRCDDTQTMNGQSQISTGVIVIGKWLFYAECMWSHLIHNSNWFSMGILCWNFSVHKAPTKGRCYLANSECHDLWLIN